MIRIAIIEGTTRPGRRSVKVAKYIQETLGKLQDVFVDLIDPAELGCFAGDSSILNDNRNEEYHKRAKEADAYILIVPEYNHSFPGTLKMLLDSELEVYDKKPVLIAGVSAGPWGGTRGIQSMIPVVRELGMVVSPVDMYFPMVHQLVDEEGFHGDEDVERRVLRAGNELLWLAKTMKWGRTNLDQV